MNSLPSPVFGRITTFCCLPEEAKNYASCCKGDQRDAVAQGVNGLHQNVERDLKEKRCILSRSGPSSSEGLGAAAAGMTEAVISWSPTAPEPETTLNAHLFPSTANEPRPGSIRQTFLE